MRKALFFDIDGTIWDEEHVIPDSTREAFQRMKERGHYLFISSGRTRVFIPDQDLLPLGFDGILAGCGTYGEFHGEVKFYHHIPQERIKRVNDFLPKGFNKATGIQEICRLLSIAHENTYSFGDSTNDLDMLEYTAHSAAMGDGMQQAKDAADFVTAPLMEDGIYKACEHYGLL